MLSMPDPTYRLDSQRTHIETRPRQDDDLQWHDIVRAMAAAISIVAARHLFNDGFHYPLLMLIVHTIIALVLEAECTRRNIESRPLSSWIDSFWQAVFSTLFAAALVFAYQAMLHSRNTTFYLMALGLTWIMVARIDELLLRSERDRIGQEMLRLATLTACTGLLFLEERMLSEKEAQLILYAAVCGATAKAIYDYNLVAYRVELGLLRLESSTIGLVTCLMLSATLLGLSGWRKRRDIHFNGRLLWIVASLVAGAKSLCSKPILARVPSKLRESCQIPLDRHTGSVGLAFLVSAIVEFDNQTAQHRPSITSGTQWLVFIIGCLSTVDLASVLRKLSSIFARNSRHTNIGYEDTLDETHDEMEPVLDVEEYDQESRQYSWSRQISTAWQTVLGGMLILLILSNAIQLHRPEPVKFLSRRDRSNSSSDLDIVIAWYNEPYEQVIKTANVALQLPTAANLTIRTIVYNKGPMNETELRLKFPADRELVIRSLDNVGREGHTYLSHLLRDVEDFSPHTMFIQAEPHEYSYLQARLRDYFVSNTGFLSLSYARNFCANCDKCNDHSGWHGDGPLLQDVFERSNPGKTCQDISLTYRGQFVVSANRMKQVDRALLRDLEDRVDERFGYTLERLWGVIFQCPTISRRCPTLLSGWLGKFENASDCQCLD